MAFKKKLKITNEKRNKLKSMSCIPNIVKIVFFYIIYMALFSYLIYSSKYYYSRKFTYNTFKLMDCEDSNEYDFCTAINTDHCISYKENFTRGENGLVNYE